MKGYTTCAPISFINTIIAVVLFGQVLEKGKLVQFDHPYLLLEDHSGPFYQMVKNLGEDHLNMLRKAAKDNFYKKGTWL